MLWIAIAFAAALAGGPAAAQSQAGAPVSFADAAWNPGQ